MAPAVSREKVARRGSSGEVRVRSERGRSEARRDRSARTTPMAPRPGGVAIATIVSVVENISGVVAFG